MSHEASAQELLTQVAGLIDPEDPPDISLAILGAQVHATLAVAAAVDRLAKTIRERDRP